MSVIGGILAIGKGIDLLWTNGSPSSSFSAQAIQINLENYFAVLIEYDALSYNDVACGFVGESSVLKCFSVNSNNRNGRRIATISTNGISFTACTYNDGTQNGYCIPLRIFGIQGRFGTGGGGGSAEIFSGPYTITPEAFNSQVLSTRNKLMIDDLTVEQIPYREEDNASGGKTVYIGTPEE